MSDVRYTANYSGLGDVLRSESMVRMLAEKAERVKTAAEAISADILGPGIPTHYNQQFRVETSTRGGATHDRAEARVVNDDEQALAVEFGVPAYRGYPKHRVLGRALDAL